MLTEQEARVKDCRINGMIPAKNKHEDPRFPKCIASACMGWIETQLPIAATTSLITGNIMTQAQPGKGLCGYARRG